MKRNRPETPVQHRSGTPIETKRPSIFMAFLVLVIILSSGCTNQATDPISTDEYGVPVNRNSNVPSDYSIESFMDVGQKVKIWYLQFSPLNKYHVGLRGPDKQLQWYYVYPEVVYLEEDIETSYIERLPDRKSAFWSSTSFVLHIKVGTPIHGGEVSNGRTSNPTTMIIEGDE